MTKNKINVPEIKHVVHSNKVCTIIWADGTKTQSVCHPEDEYSKDTGFLVAFLKKFMPTELIIELLEKWSHSQPKQEDIQKVKAIKKTEKKTKSNNKKEFDLDDILMFCDTKDISLTEFLERQKRLNENFGIVGYACKIPESSYRVFY